MPLQPEVISVRFRSGIGLVQILRAFNEIMGSRNAVPWGEFAADSVMLGSLQVWPDQTANCFAGEIDVYPHRTQQNYPVMKSDWKILADLIQNPLADICEPVP